MENEKSNDLTARSIVLFASINSFAGTFVWVLGLIYFGAYATAGIAACATVSSLVSFELARRHKLRAAKNIWLLVGSFVLFFASFKVHASGQIIFLLILMSSTCFLFFMDANERKWLIFHELLIAVLLISGVLFRSSFPFTLEVGEEIATKYAYPLTIFTVFPSVVAVLFFFTVLMQRKNRALQDAVETSLHASKAKSDFLATMSHEIRTPMNGVLGVVELLQETNLDNQQKEFLSTIRRSAFSLLRIIGDILDSSKIEANKLVIKSEPVSIRSVVDEISALLGPTARESNLIIRTSVDSNLPDFILGDEGRLSQILMNLVGNAIKFSGTHSEGEKKSIHVEVKKMEVDKLLISVSDRGIGMSAEQIEQLFNPFTQFSQSKGHKFGGTGLGLSISFSLAKLLGGTINVESEPGQGSTFIVELPCVETKAPTVSLEDDAPIPDEKARVLEGKKVLLVDDNHVNLLVICAQLERLKCVTMTAENGEVGLRKWKEGAFDLMLVDCHMPVLDGFEMTQAVRLEESQIGRKRTPVIAVTANALQGDAERCFQAGMDGYLSKPIPLAKLQKEMISHLNSK